MALRLGIGWHFYQEGAVKIQDPSWSAAHFFTGSKGPLKPLFELLVWDVDGLARLNYAEGDQGFPEIDLSKTTEVWDQYRVKVAEHYEFDDKQKDAAAKVFKQWAGQLEWYFGTHESDILKYFHGLTRRAANRDDESRQNVDSLRGQSDKIEMELSGAKAPWLAQIDDLWKGYDRALNALATPEQQQLGREHLPKPARGLLDTNTINRIVPWFDAIVGVLLILGLFTRVAALAGAGFLFSIILTQWPGAPGAEPVYYQTIEMLGMLVLAATAAGQFAGLDYVLYGFWSQSSRSNQETNK